MKILHDRQLAHVNRLPFDGQLLDAAGRDGTETLVGGCGGRVGVRRSKSLPKLGSRQTLQLPILHARVINSRRLA